MKNHEITFNPEDITGFYRVTRKAQELRAEQATKIFRDLFRLVASGYTRLASLGADMNAAHRVTKSLF